MRVSKKATTQHLSSANLKNPETTYNFQTPTTHRESTKLAVNFIAQHTLHPPSNFSAEALAAGRRPVRVSAAGGKKLIRPAASDKEARPLPGRPRRPSPARPGQNCHAPRTRQRLARAGRIYETAGIINPPLLWEVIVRRICMQIG